MAYKKSSRDKIWRKKHPKKRYVKKGRKSPLKRMIRAEIARAVETKSAQCYVTDTPIFPSSYSLFYSSLFQLSPGPSACAINQGTGNGGRIGNKITTKKLVFKGSMCPLPYNVTSNAIIAPCQLKMIIFYDKRTPTAMPTSWTSDMFQNGNGSTGFTNDFTDMWAPINSEYYTVVKTKMFKLGYQQFVATNGYNASNSGYPNNDFKLNANFSIDLTKYLPKTVTYEGNSSSPVSRGLWCAVVPVYADGNAMAASTIAQKMSYILDYKYEDA